jgi:hypothetical protein
MLVSDRKTVYEFEDRVYATRRTQEREQYSAFVSMNHVVSKSLSMLSHFFGFCRLKNPTFKERESL